MEFSHVSIFFLIIFYFLFTNIFVTLGGNPLCMLILSQIFTNPWSPHVNHMFDFTSGPHSSLTFCGSLNFFPFYVCYVKFNLFNQYVHRKCEIQTITLVRGAHIWIPNCNENPLYCWNPIFLHFSPASPFVIQTLGHVCASSQKHKWHAHVTFRFRGVPFPNVIVLLHFPLSERKAIQ